MVLVVIIVLVKSISPNNTFLLLAHMQLFARGVHVRLRLRPEVLSGCAVGLAGYVQH